MQGIDVKWLKCENLVMSIMMGEKVMAQNPFESIQDKMKSLGSKIPQLDKEAMMNSHKKNLEALTEANKMAVEVMKSITQLQSQYVKQTFEDMSSIMKDMLSNAPMSKESVSKHSIHLKDQATKAFEHTTNISATLAKSQKEIFDLMHSRYHESAQEALNMKEDLAQKMKTKH